MTNRKSAWGFGLAGIYLLASVYLLATQGIAGESFIAIILGMPWQLLLVLIVGNFDLPGEEGSLLWNTFFYAWIFLPILLNAAILYQIGRKIQQMFSKEKQPPPLS